VATTPTPEVLRQITNDLALALGWLTLLTTHAELSAEARDAAQEARAAVERASARL